MHEYDVTLKSILTRRAGGVLAELTGFAVEQWQNVELPVVRHRRADLVGETASGKLVHIELQSTNHSGMPFRMLEYALAIRRKFGKFPTQIVLYVGNDALRMKSRLAAPGLSFEYRLADIREVETEALLASGDLEDNIIAVLTRSGAQREAVQRILGRIAASPADERAAALAELTALAGLRELEEVIEREIQQMPILDDIMDNKVLGRERKRGIALGERQLVLRQIDKRFGSVPPLGAGTCRRSLPAGSGTTRVAAAGRRQP